MPPDHVSTPEAHFLHKVLIIAAVAALAASLWVLSDILLLVFASVLLAVILRFVDVYRESLIKLFPTRWHTPGKCTGTFTARRRPGPG